MAAPLKEPADDFAAGVIGVGDQEHGLGQLQAGEEDQQLIQERALVAVAEDQALVDACAQGNGVVKASTRANRARAWQEWPMMKEGLVLDSPD